MLCLRKQKVYVIPDLTEHLSVNLEYFFEEKLPYCLYMEHLNTGKLKTSKKLNINYSLTTIFD